MDINVTIEAKELTRALVLLAEAIGYLATQNPELAEKYAPKPVKAETPKKAKKETPVIAPEPEPEPEEQQIEEEQPIQSIDELRAAFARKNTPANRPKLKAILANLGVQKITLLPEDKWAEAYAQLEAI